MARLKTAGGIPLSFLLPVPLCFDTRGCLHASGMRDTGVERNGVLRSLNLQ